MNFLSILQHLLFFLPYGTICIDYKLWNFCTLTLLSCFDIQLEFFEYIFQTFVNLSNWIGFRINFRIQTYYSQYIEKSKNNMMLEKHLLYLNSYILFPHPIVSFLLYIKHFYLFWVNWLSRPLTLTSFWFLINGRSKCIVIIDNYVIVFLVLKR